MVIVKILNNSGKEREVEIVDEKGTWQSGSYHLFSSVGFEDQDHPTPEPHDVNSAKFLGEMIIDKTKATWQYHGDKLNADEEKQAARFIIDYTAPDRVY